jgi:hypothetical protein
MEAPRVRLGRPAPGSVRRQEKASRLSLLRVVVVRLLEHVEPARDPGIGALEQRAVVALDHPDARAHHLRELEHGDAGGERVRREGVAEVVGGRRCPDAGGLDGRRPYARRKL